MRNVYRPSRLEEMGFRISSLYHDVLDALKGIATPRNATLAGATLGTLIGGGCYTPPALQRQGIRPTNFEERVLHSTVDYGALDDYVKESIKELNPGILVQGIILYPVDFVFDMGRGVKAMVYDIPIETWEDINPGNAESTSGRVVRVVAIPITAPVGYVYNLGQATVKQVRERPIESVAHTASAILLINALRGGGHGGGGGHRGGGGHGGGGGGGPLPPPFEEPLPPPPPF